MKISRTSDFGCVVTVVMCVTSPVFGVVSCFRPQCMMSVSCEFTFGYAVVYTMHDVCLWITCCVIQDNYKYISITIIGKY
jgi:hypothetical protein